MRKLTKEQPWQSDIYPGKLIYEKLPDRDKYLVLWRTKRGDFVRGVITHLEMMLKEVKP